MPAIKKITPLLAVLICINSMIGGGLFINPMPLTQIAGPLGFMGYVFSALSFLPIILSIAALAQLHPVAGGLYVYSRTYVGKGAGFLSGWSYFLGKTATLALLMHKVVQFFQGCSPWLASFSTLTIDYVFIFFFIVINILGVHVGGRIQYFFTTLKAIPVLFTFAVGLLTFDSAFFVINAQAISNSFMTISTAAFSLLSFEIICSVGHLIEEPEKNIKRVIISAFLIVTTINIFFQLMVFGSLGPALADIAAPVFVIGIKALPQIPLFANVINGFVFAAITGAFFSILTSNCWNLHTLAANNHLPFAGYLTKLSKAHVPWVSLLVQGLLGCLIITISSNQIALQNMSVFTQTISFLLSVIAAYIATVTSERVTFSRFIPMLGVVSCGFIIMLSFMRIMQSGVSFSFLSIFLVGIIAALFKYFVREG